MIVTGSNGAKENYVSMLKRIDAIKVKRGGEWGKKEIYILSQFDAVISHKKIIKEAEELWEKRVDEYVKKELKENPGRTHPHGSCVLGAGFYIEILEPRRKEPRSYTILSAPSWWQSSLTWEDSADEIEKFLEDGGISVYYKWGRLD